ncbi:hypothetical protein HUU40_07980 [candidate division KSB1 bacterium]|nr:hypothetical protein [candidate division KSB1 bacterium]
MKKFSFFVSLQAQSFSQSVILLEARNAQNVPAAGSLRDASQLCFFFNLENSSSALSNNNK